MPDFAQLEEETGLRLGVHAWRLDDPGRKIGWRADERVPAASTIKLYILAALLGEVAAGRQSLNAELLLGEEDQVGGTGVLNSLAPGRPWSVHDLAVLMMIVSDNTATNLLIDLLGTEFLNGWLAAHGFSGTHLAGRLMMPGRRVSSETTPRDLADCLYRLWQGELLPEAETLLGRRIMERQHYRDALGLELGFDAFGEGSGVRIASKGGSITGVRNEVAVVSHRGSGYVAALMTSGCSDPRFWPGNPGLLAVARLNALLYRRLLEEQ